MMRVSSKRHVPAVQAYAGEIPNDYCGSAHPSPNLGTRPGETLKAPDIRVSETHLEASPVEDRLSGCSPVGAPAAQRSTKVTKSAEPACDIPGAQSSPVLGMVKPVGLFGDGLPYMRSPQHELRIELRATLARRRGTQSNLAQAVGLSRSTFAHALAGRSGFTLTAAAALRRWLDGEPVAGDWPAVPASEEENAA